MTGMMSFRGNRLREVAMPVGTAWLLADVAEAKGRQELFTRQAPQILHALRETALIQSAESSNRIEGVTVSPDRLRPLVIGNARPRDRSEEEIRGYRQALQLIHTRAADLPVTPDTLSRLHRTIQDGAGDAGQWKTVNNDIVELRPGAPPRVRFRPVAADQTPSAVDELCLSYRQAVDRRLAPPLVALAALVFDFLCVHPFRDGNGRVSRLLTLLGLYHHGYEVGRYISLERLVEEARDDYYEVLRRCSEGWHTGRHDLVPWLNYFLSVVRRAYVELETRAGRVRARRGAKQAMVEAAVQDWVGEFTAADLARACPAVSRVTIRRSLRAMQAAGLVTCRGRGPGARWRKRGSYP
jgi:Fic family protein